MSLSWGLLLHLICFEEKFIYNPVRNTPTEEMLQSFLPYQGNETDFSLLYTILRETEFKAICNNYLLRIRMQWV